MLRVSYLKGKNEPSSESGKMIPIKPVKSSQTWIITGLNSNKNIESKVYLYSVLWIWIRKFLCIKDRDPLVRCTDPDPPIGKQKIVRNPLISTVLLPLYNFSSVKKVRIRGSRTVPKCHGSGTL
jgi:hypothetical protein